MRDRPTVGLLLPNFSTNVEPLWQAAVEVAAQARINLVSFQMGKLGTAAAEALCEMIDPAYVDVLIIAPDNLLIPSGQAQTFIARFAPLPVVSIGTEVPGVLSVLPDNEYGMHTIVEHLVEVHHCRRIAYVHGPPNIAWEKARYRGYTSVLTAHHLQVEAQSIVPTAPDDTWSRGQRVMSILIDDRGLQPGIDFDALVMSNDTGAANVIRELQRRGFRIPHDVRVTGYDNTLVSLACTPPITTVQQPVKALMQTSIDLALKQLAGETVPMTTYLPPNLIIRRSCGCLSPVVKAIGEASDSNATADEPKPAMLSAVNLSPAEGRKILTAALDVTTGIEPEAAQFIDLWERMLRRDTALHEHSDAWQLLISQLRQLTLARLEDKATAIKAETLWHQARVITGESQRRAQTAHLLHAEEQAKTLRALNAALISTLDLEHSIAILADGLTALGITTAYVALDEGALNEGALAEGALSKGTPASTRWQRLILARCRGKPLDVTPAITRYPITVLLPPDLWPDQQPFNLVVIPLHFSNAMLGLALLDAGLGEGHLYDELQTELSGILRAHHLYEETYRARIAAEQANRLKTRLMANVSHELRAPLHVILRQVQELLDTNHQAEIATDICHEAMVHIQANAEHQLRMVNDLLDLSRAEIDELALSLTLIDPRPFLEEAFMDLASAVETPPEVAWELRLPPHLPAIEADPDRLRQIIYNLLSNAARFTEAGSIVLGADVNPPHLHVWVADTGAGIPEKEQLRIFEPFVTVERRPRRPEGIGLGLTITRRLVALHGGAITLESQVGQGTTFHVTLPLPARRTMSGVTSDPPGMLLVTQDKDEITPEIAELARLQGLRIYRLGPDDAMDAVLAEMQPVVMAWERSPTACNLRRLQNLCTHPLLSRIPCVFFGEGRISNDKDNFVGTTYTAPKPVSEATLIGAVTALGEVGHPYNKARAPYDGPSLLLVDDDPHALQTMRRVIDDHLPGIHVETVQDGMAAVASMMKHTPAMVVLDLNMPEMDGFEVLDWMRAYPRTRRVPVLILSGRMLTPEDIQRLENHTQVTLHSKGILSEGETAAALSQTLAGERPLPAPTSLLVKRAVAYIHQSYGQPLSRSDIAEAVGVSDDYLTTIFKQELGLTPWDYLTRYRITQACHLLDCTGDAIGAIAQAVGFDDPAYFSRVFKKIVGTSPSAYRAR